MTDRPTTPTGSDEKCPDCWAATGDQHELSCPTVSLEEFAATVDAVMAQRRENAHLPLKDRVRAAHHVRLGGAA